MCQRNGLMYSAKIQLNISTRARSRCLSNKPKQTKAKQNKPDITMAATNTAASTLAALQEHLNQQHPSIKLITPSSPDFEGVRACFIKKDDAVPLAIARPQNAADVQALVRYCTQHGVDFVVRAGGHDCAGRSQVGGVLTIDVRDIKHVLVSDDEKTARVGGGVVFRDLTKELDARGLITPV